MEQFKTYILERIAFWSEEQRKAKEWQAELSKDALVYRERAQQRVIAAEEQIKEAEDMLVELEAAMERKEDAATEAAFPTPYEFLNNVGVSLDNLYYLEETDEVTEAQKKLLDENRDQLIKLNAYATNQLFKQMQEKIKFDKTKTKKEKI